MSQQNQTAHTPSTNNSTPQTFSAVYEQELQYIYDRRKSLKTRNIKFVSNDETSLEDQSWTTQSSRPATDEQEKNEVHQQQDGALKRDLCGLAISGGGIRSATFGLGVLQGLAKSTLLPRFDYISTVSGGGYIGSFFSKLVYEKTFAKAELGLLGNFDEVACDDTDCNPGSEFLRIHARRDTSKEINHLRQYSNYLAPTPGFFSLDGWLLFAIYIRNLLLNQAVLFLGAAGLVLLLRFVAEIFCMGKPSHLLNIGFEFFVFGLAALALGQIFLMNVFRQSCQRPTDGLASAKPARYWWMCSRILALVLAGFVSLFVEFDDWPSLSGVLLGEYFGFWAIVLAQTLSFSLLGLLCHHNGLKGATTSILAGAFAGFIGGVVVAAGLLFSTQQVHWNVVFSVPLIIVVFVLSEMIYVGMAGLSLDELDREWWSSVNSRLLLFSLLWVVVFSIAILGPWLFEILWNANLYGAIAAIFGGSAGSLILGLLSAKSSKTGSEKSRSSEILALVAPVVFLLLILLTLSIVTSWLSYEVYSLIYDNQHRGFFKTVAQGDYITDLNKPVTFPILGQYFYGAPFIFLAGTTLICASMVLADRVGANTFSLHNMYANRLIRCYLGASTEERKPNALTNFAAEDDIELSLLATCKIPMEAEKDQLCEMGPLHIINGALNQSSRGSSLSLDKEELAASLRNQDRMSESFVFTPLHCGSQSTGYRMTSKFAGDIKLGQALAVSGAAVSPNMGYHSSAAITALLTVFNLRLGAWFGNPMFSTWEAANPTVGRSLFVNELLGNTNAKDEYIYVSDGGHFENMGVYELIRRRCRFVVAVDADAAPNLHENIGRLVRMARIDFGVRIEIDSTAITPDENGLCQSHVVVGRIHYGDVHKPKEEQPPHDPSYLYENNQGIIVWIALAATGDEPADVKNYRAMNQDFPYRTTADQFFDENEFESYRELGEHSVEAILRHCTLPITKNNGVVDDSPKANHSTFAFSLENTQDHNKYVDKKKEVVSFINGTSTRDIFKSIFDKWLVRPGSMDNYVSQNEDYVAILQKLRSDSNLENLTQFICGNVKGKAPNLSEGTQADTERLMIGEMMTLLENVWFSLDFQNSFLHPLHRGWLNVFRIWTGNPVFEQHWFNESDEELTGIQNEFSPGFQRFIETIRRVKNTDHEGQNDEAYFNNPFEKG